MLGLQLNPSAQGVAAARPAWLAQAWPQEDQVTLRSNAPALGNPGRTEITVLLSLFRGAAFLQEQLDSIAAQRGVTWRVYWRHDDVAPDLVTARLMERFATQHSSRVRQAQGGNLGIAGSFGLLLALVPDEAGHVAFADQDDVWLPTKLERASRALSSVPSEVPALYCGRQQLVDAELRPIGLSPLPQRGLTFANALVQNVATGCTVMLNRAARRLLARLPAPEGSLHDWWAYIVVSAFGGQVIYDPEPGVLYRQHATNAVGARHTLLRRGLLALTRGPSPFLSRLEAHVAALHTHRDILPPASIEVLRWISDTHASSPLRRLRALQASGAYRQHPFEDAALRLWLALRRLPSNPLEKVRSWS